MAIAVCVLAAVAFTASSIPADAPPESSHGGTALRVSREAKQSLVESSTKGYDSYGLPKRPGFLRPMLPESRHAPGPVEPGGRQWFDR